MMEQKYRAIIKVIYFIKTKNSKKNKGWKTLPNIYFLDHL